MSAVLAEIVSLVRRRVSQTRSVVNWRDLERRARQHNPRGFRRTVESKAQEGVAVIAELKKASPSRGLIRAAFHPGELAAELAEAGAAALSVLTEEEFFQGSLENLSVASGASPLPCLRKDFVVDEFQILEARAYGADAVLLIVAALSPGELARLLRQTQELELDALCEVHDENELMCAIDVGCNLVGVNSRDLRSFEVDLNTALQIGRLIPKSLVSVAESGIRSAGQITQLRAEGYQGFLIGESLMKAERPGEALGRLLAEAGTTVSL
ncbi:MAG: indole-3-glycerol phosphate synthase TrpC [Acidobacteria bacterium]|nr:indole-3-glycerol phosphate synthase TrpC [Acidobacteriota bacterium]